MHKLYGLSFVGSQQREPMFFTLGRDFLDNSDSPYGYSKFEGHIRIDGEMYDEENDDSEIVEVGEIRFHAYNLEKLKFNYFDKKDFKVCMEDSPLAWAMDVDSSDTSLYFAVFANGFNKAVKGVSENEWTDMAFSVNEGYLVTLDRCYIKPEYRKMGVGQYIHENLFKILYTEFNITTLFVVGICVPDKNEPENMKDVQKKILKNNGFNVFKCSNETAFCKYVYDLDFLLNV